jgi:hypothetical protein
VRRGLCAVALVAVIGILPSALAGPALEPPRVCEGLTICGQVAGPWVVVPGPARGASTVSGVWMIGCPRRGIVGGTDARVSDPWVEVSFTGRIGAPVNPGITTGREVLFTGVSVGPSGRASSFIPFIGCIPSQGGPRVPTSRASPTQYSPRRATSRRVRVIDVRTRRASAGLACKPNERLVGSASPIGIYTALKPTASQLRGVHVTRSVAGRKVFVAIRRVAVPLAIAVEVQIHALCARRLAP